MSGQTQIILEAKIVREYHHFKDDYKWEIKVRNSRGGFDYYGPLGRGPYTSPESAYFDLRSALTNLLEKRKSKGI